jgi:carbamoyl-phosphate synthase large subunit
VLVFPGGTEIGLEIAAALRDAKEVELFSAGVGGSSHAPVAFRRHAAVRSVHEEGWLDDLGAVLAEQDIDFVFPAYDDVLLALAENSDRIDARVLTSPLETCRITRLKSLTYAALAGVVSVPRVYADAGEVDRFPVFVKPDRGQGSHRARLARDPDELRCALADGDLILEHLPGDEFTVDCFSDRERGLLFCSGRRRVRVRNGISVDSVRVDDPRFGELARGISSRLDLWGAWFFQLREDAAGELCLLEVGPRIAGTMALHRVLGVNFPLLTIYEAERIPVTILLNDLDIRIDRALANRYRHELDYDAVYVDLDDTLLRGADVNPRLVSLVFQCLNAGKRVVLLTRHRGEVAQTLARYRLAGLWDDIVRVADEEEKAAHIGAGERAILIDDSFRERRIAAERLGISTFDASMIEMLIDDGA